ncbi:hypothetical protein G6011_09411 [Alternaria panax]|uniref:Uncharacterized protein n=1 Tax=Alternaria panax TaxID=48097 RepID=A0AAD4IB84_9PLEO|nr:hypothetical protein G6011_09411 [Alternaria panax]
MADRDDFSRPAEEALLRLANFKAHNPLCVTTVPAVPQPSPCPGLPSPSMSSATYGPQRLPPTPSFPQFQPSRMNIPPTAYAPAYAPTRQVPEVNRIPGLATQRPYSQPPAPQTYQPLVYPEPVGFITQRMVYDRIYILLRDNLTNWWTRNPAALHAVTHRLAGTITYSGPKGMFGPDGIQSPSQISLYIGREGIYRYMCLAVNSKQSAFSIILKGDLCEKDGNDPLYDEELMALCKDGFDRGVTKLYTFAVAENERKAGQKN